jgi:hypothetical protein
VLEAAATPMGLRPVPDGTCCSRIRPQGRGRGRCTRPAAWTAMILCTCGGMGDTPVCGPCKREMDTGAPHRVRAHGNNDCIGPATMIAAAPRSRA